MRDYKFWMVYNPNGYSPVMIHETYTEAEQEAKRLACKTGNGVYILKATQRVIPPAARCEVEDLKGA